MALKKWVFGTKLSQQITEQNANIDEIENKLANLPFGTPTALGTTDLNTIVKSGHFYQNVKANIKTTSNYPEAEAGILLSFYSVKVGSQIYITTYSNDVYIRVIFNEVWGAWKRLAPAAY